MNQILTIISIAYLFFILLFCVFNTIFNFRISKSQLKFILFFVVIACCFVAYNITHVGTTTSTPPDIVRYYEILENMQNVDFATAMKEGEYSATIATNILFFIVAKIGNFALIKVFSTLISMTCLMYIVYKTAFINTDKNHVNYIMPFMLFLLSGYGFITIFTGIRQPIAISILLVALFNDLYLRKRNFKTLILYILPILFHTQVVVPLAIRIISSIKFSKINYLIVLIPSMLSSLLILFNGLNPLFDLIIEKYYIYIDYIYENRWEFVSQVIKFLVYSTTIWYLLINNYQSNFRNGIKLSNFLRNFILFQIATINIEHLFYRNLKILNVMMLPLIYIYFAQPKTICLSEQTQPLGESSLLNACHRFYDRRMYIFIILALFALFDCALQCAQFNGWIISFV